MLLNKKSLINSLIATSFTAALLAAAPAASAQEDDGLFQFSANVAVTSDYRFRGVSLSGRAFAVQGGLDVSTDSGFYVGTWGSSIDPYNGSELELDIYAGYTGELGGFTYDVGLLEYTYPGSVGPSAYLEGYASVSGALQDLEWTLGGAYAFSQESLGDKANKYVYLDLAYPLGDTGLSLSGHVAREGGSLAWDTKKWDWSVGASYPVGKFEASVAYYDTNIEDFDMETITSGGIVFSLGTSF